MKLETGKRGKRGLAALLGILLLAGAVAGLAGCSKSDIVEYEHDGLVVPFAREFYKEIELTPQEELGEDVLVEVYSKEDGAFLFRLLSRTQAGWEKDAIEACREGGSVKAFARKEDTVYVVEGPSAEQAGGAQAGEEELPDGGEQAQQQGELPGLLERIRQTNGLEEFEPHLYEEPYLMLFAASGAAKQSWSDIGELPPEYLCDFFPDAYVWEGGDLSPYVLQAESSAQQYLVPSDVFEGLLMRYFDVTPELLRAMPQYNADKNAYLAASGTKPQTRALVALFCEEGQDGLLTLRYYVSIEGQEDGLREVTVQQTGEKSYRYVSFAAQDEMTARRYYDYFEQHSAQLNPLFSFPSGDEQEDNEALMIFALQNMPLPEQKVGVSKQSIDEVLYKYFGRTVTDYETNMTRELPSGNITWDGFSFHGTVRPVLRHLQQQDGGKKGVFEVYVLPEDDLSGYGGSDNVLERLRQGQTQGLEKLYAGELTLVFEEVEDLQEPLGFYIRYQSVKFDSVSDVQEQSLYFYNGSLLGSFDGQGWYSLCDLTGGGQQSYTVSADATPRIYTANDVLAAPIYYLFEEGAFSGHSDWLIWPAGTGGLGEFESPQANDILSQAGTLWESEEFGSREFYRMQLPGTLYEDGAALRIPDYSFVTYFGESVGQEIAGSVGEDVSLLVTNANHDLAAVQVQELDLSKCDVDDAVAQIFAQAGMGNTRPNLVRAQQGDFDADGEPETIYTLISPKDEGGWPLMEGEGVTGDVGTFALLLYEDEELQVVFSDLRPWRNGEEVTFEDGFFPVSDIDYCHDVEVSAVADLDGDGDCELVVTCSLWEGGYTLVFSQNGQGRYEAVMRSNWGS